MEPTETTAGRRVWLFPATYLVHIAEEYGAGRGFPAWLSDAAGVRFTPGHFLALNAVFWLAMAACAALVLRRPRWSWMAAGLAVVVLVNTLLHLFGTLATRAYSPGLVSGLALWLPLGATVLRRCWTGLPRRAFWRGVLAGAAAHAAVSLLALGLGGASG